MSEFEMTAKTMAGLEELLMEELKAIGATDLKKGVRMVAFNGTTEVLYKANLHCRTALKILVPLGSFKAQTEAQLYEGVKAFNWKKYLEPDGSFLVDAIVNSRYFNHSHYVALKAKDAIVDQFRDYFGRRPDIRKDNPDVSINIHCREDIFTVSLDSSGESLHKRGYRIEDVRAPLSEVLAAGMIMLSGWDKKSTFVDPMCGSGTIAIEAALMARNIAPGSFRREFGFHNWKDFQPELWKKVTTEAREAELPPADEPLVYANEILSGVAGRAKGNIKSTGLESDIQLSCSDFHEMEAPPSPGTLIMNPPYGERLRPGDVENFYKSIGDTFKSKYSGYNCWILTSNMDALKVVGLKPSRKIPLYNGKLECKFVKYEMYQGSKKEKPQSI